MTGNKYDWIRALGIAAGAGMTLLCMILFGLYLGYLVDDHFGTAYWGLMIGGFLGGACGLWTIVKQLVGK